MLSTTNNALLLNSGLPQFQFFEIAQIQPTISQLIQESHQQFLSLEEKLNQPLDNYSIAELYKLTIEETEKIDYPLNYAWSMVSHLKSVTNSPELRKAYEESLPKIIEENTYTSQYEPWVTLEEIPGAEKIKFDVFNETPDLLEVSGPVGKAPLSYYFRSTLLRSNCKITKQPDSGDIYIYFKGNKTVTQESLLKWIVSFRNECHFHEEICEAAYKRLWDALQPKELVVTCFYARRGGWDIVPTRASKKGLLDKALIDPKTPYFKFPRQ